LETSKDAGLPIFQHIVRLRPLKACGTCRNVCCLEWMSLYIACSPVLFGKYPQAIWQSHGKIRQKYPCPSLSYHFSENLGTAQGEASIRKSKLHRPTTAKGFQDLTTTLKSPNLSNLIKVCRKTLNKDILTSRSNSKHHKNISHCAFSNCQVEFA